MSLHDLIGDHGQHSRFFFDGGTVDIALRERSDSEGSDSDGGDRKTTLPGEPMSLNERHALLNEMRKWSGMEIDSDNKENYSKGIPIDHRIYSTVFASHFLEIKNFSDDKERLHFFLRLSEKQKTNKLVIDGEYHSQNSLEIVKTVAWKVHQAKEIISQLESNMPYHFRDLFKQSYNHDKRIRRAEAHLTLLQSQIDRVLHRQGRDSPSIGRDEGDQVSLAMRKSDRGGHLKDNRPGISSSSAPEAMRLPSRASDMLLSSYETSASLPSPANISSSSTSSPQNSKSEQRFTPVAEAPKTTSWRILNIWPLNKI